MSLDALGREPLPGSQQPARPGPAHRVVLRWPERFPLRWPSWQYTRDPATRMRWPDWGASRTGRPCAGLLRWPGAGLPAAAACSHSGVACRVPSSGT